MTLCKFLNRAALPQGTDLSGFDGISLRVKGDGKRYKLNIKSTVSLDVSDFLL
jgi:hypothetical protein